MSEEKEGTTGLFEEIVKLGIPHSNYRSDLYIPVTEQTTEIVKRRGIFGTVLCTTFRSILTSDNNAWFYEISFAYTPYYDSKKS